VQADNRFLVDSSADRVCCPLCGPRDAHFQWRENGYEGHLCSCGLMYISPQPSSDVIDLTFDGHLRSYYARPARMKLRWLSRSHPVGTLVEVGCGDGDFLEAAIEYGYTVGAIEAHPERATQVAKRLGIRVEAAFVEGCQWPKESCDIVYHCDLLSHFPDPHLALRQMCSLLRPGGILFFEVGIVAEISPRWYRLMTRLGMPEHRWFYSERSLRRVLSQCGLNILRLKRFGLAPSFLLSRLGRTIGYGGGATTPRQMTATAGQTVGLAEWRRAFERQRDVADGPLKACVHNFVRYRVGAAVPRVGPQTFLVIAAPKDERAAG
jgi:SAM-dependent methyltransferase